MPYRITKKDLDSRCKELNEKTKNPTTMFKFPIGKEPKGYKGSIMNAGHFYTQTQEGGTRLEQIANPGGGATDISPFRGTKREIFDYIKAMLEGIEHYEKSLKVYF
jgi:hypothetical protein